MDTDNPIEEALSLAIEAEQRAREAVCGSDRTKAARRIMEIERDVRKRLDRMKIRYRVVRPRIGMTRALRKDWTEYREKFEDLLAGIGDVRDSVETMIAQEVTRAEVSLSTRERMEVLLQEVGGSARERTKDGRKDVDTIVEGIQERTRRITKACVQKVELAIRKSMADFARTDLNSLNAIAVRSKFEARIREATEAAVHTLESLRAQLSAVDLTGESTVVDQLEAVEERNAALEEQAAIDLHYAQLGMAIGIISHEFGAAIRSVRLGLKRLKAWADVNEDLTSLYQNIRGNFDHLDGYLSLFTPLQRRLYRKATDIRGWEIRDFLVQLFGERLARHEIELTATKAFATTIVRGYPSSFYPVFVNLVDNAIYWLSGQNKRLERKVVLDVRGEVLLVRDSGPGIYARDRDDIFDIGFTRKPGGRGMGLYIARETLRENGYDLSLEENESSQWTTFLIAPVGDKGD